MRMSPHVFVIAAAILGATGGIFIRSLGEVPALAVAFFRFGIPAVCLGAYFFIKKIRPFRERYIWMILLSILVAARLILLIYAFLLVSLGTAQTILFTFPLFIALFGILFLKEKPDTKTWWLLILAFLGILTIYAGTEATFESTEFIGMILILMAAIIHAIAMIISKRESHVYTSLEIVFHQSFIGGILFLPFIIFAAPSISQHELLVGLAYGLVIGVLTWILYFRGLKGMKVAHWSILAYIEVPTAMIYGLFIYGEEVTKNMLIGAVFIISAGIGLIMTKYTTKNQ